MRWSFMFRCHFDIVNEISKNISWFLGIKQNLKKQKNKGCMWCNRMQPQFGDPMCVYIYSYTVREKLQCAVGAFSRKLT